MLIPCHEDIKNNHLVRSASSAFRSILIEHGMLLHISYSDSVYQREVNPRNACTYAQLHRLVQPVSRVDNIGWTSI